MRYQLLLAFMACNLFCGAQELTVWAINGTTGRPLSKEPVSLSAKDPRIYPRQYLKLLARATTAPDGKAVFSLPKPLPSSLVIEVGELGGTFACSPKPPEFPTGEVLSSGIVQDDTRCDRRRKIMRQFAAKPGNVVIFIKRLTGWNRFLQEIF